jgi:stage IV sporulation protein FB
LLFAHFRTAHGVCLLLCEAVARHTIEKAATARRTFTRGPLVLAEPERTPYDLRFHLLRFPVRIHPWFWLGSVLLGSNHLEAGLEYLAIWVAVVFVSILVHELGHALAFRWYGADSAVVLYAFGGLAIPSHNISGRWRRIAVALAGPFAGFALCGIVYGSNEALGWVLAARSPELASFYGMLVFVNLVWGIMNLLPVYPLDGGQVCRELCGMKWHPTRATRISLKISFGTALAVVGWSIFCAMDRSNMGAGVLAGLPWWVPQGTVYTAILFGILAYQSYQLLQRVEWTDTHWDDRLPWEK